MAGLLSRITQENGDFIEYSYDAINQLKTETKKSSLGVVLYSYSYTYDAAKNRLAMVKNGITTFYSYNNLNQLTQTSGGDSTTYTYDLNGNQIKTTTLAGVTTYAYDSENRLTKITYPDLTTSTFTYDGDGRRIKSAEGAAVTNYLYDGSLPVIERNALNVTQVTYAHSLGYPGGIGGLISQTRAGVSSWYHYAHTGPTNVSHLSDSSGSIIQRYQFDAFGNLTYQSGTATNNYRFQTKELHDKSNLVYFGARWYNPAIGRWITPDPAGIIDGPNLYIYLNNNPINDIDPWGLCMGPPPWGQKWWIKDGKEFVVLGKKQSSPWWIVVGGITLASPIPGDEVVFWTGVGVIVVGDYVIHQFGKYNKKGPLWDAPGMQGWYQKQYEQSQPGSFTPPPNFKKGEWWKKIIWAIGKIAEAFHKD